MEHARLTFGPNREIGSVCTRAHLQSGADLIHSRQAARACEGGSAHSTSHSLDCFDLGDAPFESNATE
eukprot:1204231-Pleurochrysis_carterae.AAC.1